MCDESGLRGGSGRVAALSGEMRRNPAFGGNIILHNIYYRRNAWQKIAQNQELGKYFSVTWACPPLLQPVKYKKPLDPAPTSRTPSTPPPPPANSPAAALIQPATSRISGAPLQAASHAVMHAQTGLPIDTAIWLAAQEARPLDRTQRQRRNEAIMRMKAQGLSNAQIGERINMHAKSVAQPTCWSPFSTI